MNFVETHRSYVNTWECDENAHMNVQFYFERFDQARRLFDLTRDAPPADYPTDRHVRFHSECAAATLLVVRSALLPGGSVMHRMSDVVTGRLAATALDTTPSFHGADADSPNVRDGLPRSLQPGCLSPLDPAAFAAAGAMIAHQMVVRPLQADPAGSMAEAAHVSMFTDGAPHIWEAANITHGWLAARGYGRVAVEMKLTRHRVVPVGEGVRLLSAVTQATAKVIRVRHEIVSLPILDPVASGEVTGLVMDLSSRRAVALPDRIETVQVEDLGG